MPDVIFAFDKQTARSKDADGRMRVKNCILSTAEINPYRGQEIPGWQKLGLDANRVYELFRDPEELNKAVPTFEGLPLMVKHIPQTADQPRKEYIGGSVHSITFDGKHLRGDLLVMDGYAIDLIESGELADLSCGYRYDPVMQSGEADGEKFDGVMRKIEGNHVALVDDGRASGAHVADHALRDPRSPDPSMQGDSTMPFPEKEPTPGAAPEAGAGGAANPAPGSPEGEQNEQSNMAAIGQSLKHIAMLLENIHAKVNGGAAAPGADNAGAAPSGEMPPGEPSREAEDGELTPAVGGEREEGEGAMDEEGESGAGYNTGTGGGQEGTEARGEPTPHGAMDAKSVQTLVAAAVANERKRAQAVETAKRDVLGILGPVYGMDSAGAIYRMALEQAGVDVKQIAKGQEKVAFDAYKLAAGAAAGVRSPAMAMDSASDAATANQKSIAGHLARISVKG